MEPVGESDMKNQKCLRTTQLVSMEQDGELPLWERLTMRLHLLACADCRHFRENSASLRRIMQHYAGGDAIQANTMTFQAASSDEGDGRQHHDQAPECRNAP